LKQQDSEPKLVARRSEAELGFMGCAIVSFTPAVTSEKHFNLSHWGPGKALAEVDFGVFKPTECNY